MKVSTSELPPRQLALEIEVEQERVDRAIDGAYRRIANRVKVPGFRPGKAPRTMVERMIGRESIVEDALEHLVPDVVNEAIEQEKVEAYSRPRVESVEVEPLRVKAVVPLAPKVELGDYAKQVRVERPEVTVEPKQVDEVIDRLREARAQWVPVERPVQQGDRVGIDLRGEVAETERVLVDAKDAEYVIDPEGAQPAPGFAEQIVGLSADDEKAFTLPLAEDYREKDLAGKDVQFSVTVHWVKERQLPELDDAFAQEVGDYADVAGLREAIEKQIREREEERVRSEFEEAILDKLVEVSTVEVAPQVVDHQAEHMLETFASNLERQGLQLNQYLRFAGKDEAALRDEFRADAEKRVKRSLALDAFEKAEQIGVEPGDVEAEVKKAAANTTEPDKAETATLGNPDAMARVEAALRERKAIERLEEIATSNGTARPARRGKKNLSTEAVEADTEASSEPAASATATEAQENA